LLLAVTPGAGKLPSCAEGRRSTKPCRARVQNVATVNPSDPSAFLSQAHSLAETSAELESNS